MSDNCPPTDGIDSQTGTITRELVSYRVLERPASSVETDEEAGKGSIEPGGGCLATVSRMEATSRDGLPLEMGVMSR
jgi:hypothetical protein